MLVCLFGNRYWISGYRFMKGDNCLVRLPMQGILEDFYFIFILFFYFFIFLFF